MDLFSLLTEDVLLLLVVLLVYSPDLRPSVRTLDEVPDLRSSDVLLMFVPVVLLVEVVALLTSPEAVVLRLPAIAEASRVPTLLATPEPVAVRLPYLTFSLSAVDHPG